METLISTVGAEVAVWLIGLVVVGIGSGITYLSKKLSDYIRNQIENEYFQDILLRVTEVVTTTVKAAMQEQVDDLKEKAEKGKLKKQDARRIKNEVVEDVVNQLSDEALDGLENLFGDAEKYIGKKVESAVRDVKEGKE